MALVPDVDGKHLDGKRKTVITYSNSIPRYLPAKLGITRLTLTPEAQETTLGKVTVQRLARKFFEDQITEYNHLTPEQRQELNTTINRNDREVTLATEILHHPHVLKICCFIVETVRVEYTAENSDDILGMATEYAPGGNVEQYLKNGNRLGDREVFIWILQLAKTMAYFHDDLSIMHRDISPLNIFVFEGGKLIKLGNFHYARKSGGENLSFRTDPNIVYCAPEVIADNTNKYGLSADVWSFGIFLYYITHVDANGHPRVPFPLNRNSATQFRDRLEKGEQCVLDESLHPDFVYLIKKCLTIEDKKRQNLNVTKRMRFSDIVRYLEERREAFAVEEVL